MRLPIPNDWKLGNKVRCIEIIWPDSTQWDMLLSGFLYGLSKGRTWEGSTGSIIGAQEIGRYLWAQNKALVSCGERDEGAPANGGGMLVLGEDDMGQVVTDVVVENGLLRVYFGPCCWKDLKLPTEQEGQEPQDPQENEDNPDEPVYSACGKAYAIVDEVYKVADSAWDQRDTADPWTWDSTVEQQSGVDVNGWHIGQAVFQAQMIGVILPMVTKEDVMDTDIKQAILCRVVSLFEDDFEGVDEDKWNQIIGVFSAEWGVLDAPIANFWNFILMAYGRSNANRAARAGAMVTDRDCGCPEPEEQPNERPPVNSTWVQTWDFTSGNMEGWVKSNQGLDAFAGEGVRLTDLTQGAGVWTWDITFPRQRDVVHAINYLFIEVEAEVGHDQYITGVGKTAGFPTPNVSVPIPTDGGTYFLHYYVSNVVMGPGDTIKAAYQGNTIGAGNKMGTIRKIVVAGTGDNPLVPA